MRYLAEIQKQSKGFMGGFDTKLKLLACQRNDRSWSVVSGNEFIETDDTGNLGDGALIIVDIANRQSGLFEFHGFVEIRCPAIERDCVDALAFDLNRHMSATPARVLRQ